jgi:zinc protease
VNRVAAALAALVAAVPMLGGVAAAQVPNWPSERPPRPLAAREAKFPPYTVRTLSNGLQVIAVSHHEQPAVSLRLIVRVGGAQDPANKPGLASLASALLDQGTLTRTAEQIANSIDSIGGAVGAGSGSDLTFINAVVMKDSFNFALDLVSDIARNPAFSAQEIDRQRQQILSGLKVSYEDPEYLAGVVFDRLVYGFHPYGRPDSGTPQSIESITRDDLVAFHKAWFGANNAILAIVGDVTPEEAFAGAERAFGTWGSSAIAAPKPHDLPPPTRRVVVVDRPGAVQTEIRAGNVALPRKHPDYLALDLAMKILGGEGGNRLHRVLRSERGLTYGASADVHALKDGGDIVAETDTRSETTAEALRLLVDEMWRLQRQRVEPRELADAQAYLTGNFPLTIETPSAIALQVLNAVFYGLDLNELQTFRERVNAITVDDIQRVAKQYLHPDRLSIVLVGDASVFAKQLPAVGFDRFERVPLAELDLTSVDLRRHATPQPQGRILPIVHRPDDVHALVDRAVRAKGGLEKLRSIRTVRVKSTTILLQASGGRVEVPTTVFIRYPGAFRVDAEFPNGTLVQAFNAGEYWVQDSRGSREAPPAIAAEIRTNVQRDTIALLLALVDGKVAAAAAEPIIDGARRLPTVAAEAPSMRRVTLIFDPDTALLLRQRYADPTAGVMMEEAYSDYRPVDGIQVAFRAEIRMDGTPIVERNVRAFEYNVALDPSLFTKPG